MNLYPFAAIVGQEKLKKALLLCAVNPGIGGVLIQGEKGTAKTTAVRGLAAVMPPLPDSGKPVPFVDLPLGASEDRVLGSLDMEAILSGKTKKLLPGLLAAAHQGILYIDEVNLLADHLVDVLLDVAASGVNTIQREGLSVSHPSRFVLIGTMNPEEGNLRPQFLDRFGLMVQVGAETDVEARTEVVRRRMAFERNPDAFAGEWLLGEHAVREKINAARALLPDVEMPDGLLNMISQLCVEWGVGSLRADIVMYKTAVTLAALQGRKSVVPQDVKEAAELVLTHRKGKKSSQPGLNQAEAPRNQGVDEQTSASHQPEPNQDRPDAPQRQDVEPGDIDTRSECGEGNCDEDSHLTIAGIDSGMNVPELTELQNIKQNTQPEGRGARARQTVKGYQVRAIRTDMVSDLAVTETILHAVARNPDAPVIERQDFHHKIRRGKTGRLILFVVDASGSMAAAQRMEAVKGSVMRLLDDAYQKRNTVAVISFRGVEAEVLLEPTRSTDLAAQALAALPTGGRTPLPHALELARDMLASMAARGSGEPLLVLLSDGKANVPLPGAGGDPWAQSLQLAGAWTSQALVIDTESGYIRYGKARELAAALGADYIALEELSAHQITETIANRIAS